MLFPFFFFKFIFIYDDCDWLRRGQVGTLALYPGGCLNYQQGIHKDQMARVLSSLDMCACVTFTDQMLRYMVLIDESTQSMEPDKKLSLYKKGCFINGVVSKELSVVVSRELVEREKPNQQDKRMKNMYITCHCQRRIMSQEGVLKLHVKPIFL